MFGMHQSAIMHQSVSARSRTLADASVQFLHASVCLCVHLSMFADIGPFVHASVRLSVHQSMFACVGMFVSMHQSRCASISVHAHVSICMHQSACMCLRSCLCPHRCFCACIGPFGHAMVTARTHRSVCACIGPFMHASCCMHRLARICMHRSARMGLCAYRLVCLACISQQSSLNL